MKKVAIFILIMFVTTISSSDSLWAFFGAKKDKEAETNEEVKQQVESEPKAQSKVVYEFKKEELHQFKRLYQKKQMILNRIAVLRNYINKERTNIDDVNGQLYLKFKMEPGKNYNLDRPSMTLQELPPPETQPAAQE